MSESSNADASSAAQDAQSDDKAVSSDGSSPEAQQTEEYRLTKGCRAENSPAPESPESPPSTHAVPPTDVVPVDDDLPSSNDLTGSAADRAEQGTLAAPSFRAPMGTARVQERRPELDLHAGATIDDFQIVELIGRGAFGGVYLAKQLSLDRHVALKVSANRGSEGRTLAQLEHEFIVQVFSETADESGRFRLLCMQLVVGTALDDVIERLRLMAARTDELGRPLGWGGQQYLEAIDAGVGLDDGRSRVHDVFDPTALKDRERINHSDDIQTVAIVGARLAEAVDYAHRRSVLHRDIKPANVLVNRYGRPLLADFNIAERTMPDGGTSGSFGGTIAFMAPEHLDAFNPRTKTGAEVVDERSDLYSLGIVLHELLTGRSPFEDPEREAGPVTFVGNLAEARRATPPPIGDGPPGGRKVLERTIARVLEPEKENRYASGADFAAALEGAGALRSAERAFPTARWLTRAMQRNALLWLALLVIIPQAISSVVNITYNNVEIRLNEPQNEMFWNRLIPIYNVLAYPLLLGLGAYVVVPIFKVWKEVHGNQPVDPQRVAEARRRALQMPVWLLMLVAAGWLPGGLLFPLMLDALSGPVGWNVYAHFITSFTLSGLIAAAYSFAGLQYLVLRVMYPRLWVDATNFQQTVRSELASSLWRVRFVPTLSYSIPVVAVLLIVAAASTTAFVTDSKSVEPSLLVLCGLLNLLGLVGVLLVGSAARRMARTVVALTGQQV